MGPSGGKEFIAEGEAKEGPFHLFIIVFRVSMTNAIGHDLAGLVRHAQSELQSSCRTEAAIKFEVLGIRLWTGIAGSHVDLILPNLANTCKPVHQGDRI